MMQRRNVSSYFRAPVFWVTVLCTLGPGAAGAKPGGAKTPAPSDPVPMHLEQESYFFRVPGEDACIGEDDRLDWTASGSLAPGESFTFTPQLAGCVGHPAAISIVATWSNGALDLTSQVPDADLASRDASQAGLTIHAPMVDLSAQLCMFPRYRVDDAYYSVTLSNNSSEAVYDIVLDGQHRNDWSIHYYPRCINADADGDGWNDSLEHSMTNLLYLNSYIDGVFQGNILWGSNYLQDRAQTPFLDDEIDSYPPDFNDDGRVDDFDLMILDDWLGQGNGITLEEIDPNPGEFWYHNNTLPWRRYDLDGDGFVGEEDRLIVTQVLDQVVPMDADSISPTARVTSPSEGGSVPAGEYAMITAHVWDNAALSRVEYLVNGRTVCSQSDPLPSFGFTSPLYYCWWKVPKRKRIYEFEILVLDAAGNTSLSEPVLVRAN